MSTSCPSSRALWTTSRPSPRARCVYSQWLMRCGVFILHVELRYSLYHHAPVCCCLWQPQVRKLYTVICAVIFGKQAVDAGGTAPRAGPSGPLVVSFATRMVYLYLRDALVRLSGAGPGRVADSPSEAAVPHRAVVRTLVSSPFMCRAPGVSCCFTPPLHRCVPLSDTFVSASLAP